MENLQSRIKSSRVDQGLSQAALADLTGVSQPTVANWENGSHTPRHSVLMRIGEALGVEPIWLLSGSFAEGDKAVQNYMKRPIRHIPVYSWPVSGQTFAAGPARGYLPFSTHHDHLLGALRLREDEEAYEVIVLNTQEHPSTKPGRYIVARDKAVIMTPSSDILSDDKIYGLMVARLSYY